MTTAAPKPPITPKFGGGGEKCKTCEKTVYPQERISYDNGTWHQLCFKCQQCRSTLSLAAVAMINGDLYCKTCFKKIFLKEGKYSSFESAKTHTLPKDFKEAAGATSGSSSPPPESLASPAGQTRRSPSPSIARSPSPSTSSSAPLTPVQALQAAVERKDATAVHVLLDENGASLLFAKVKSGTSVLEWALTSYMHRSSGVRMLDWLEERTAGASKALDEAHAPNSLKGKKTTEETAEVKPEPTAEQQTTDKAEETKEEAEGAPTEEADVAA